MNTVDDTLVIQLQAYQPAMAEEWDRFVWSSNNGTLFHTRRFLSYHPPDRFEDNSLVFFKEGRILALVPAVRLNRQGRYILASHTGASYGGFVTQSELSIKDAFRLVESLLFYARQNGFHGVEMTPPPQIYLHRPSDYVAFALYKNGFMYRKREVSSVIPLDFNDDEVLFTFNESSRRAVRRALKQGVYLRDYLGFADFYPILKKNLKLRHNVQPTHSLDELLRLYDLFPDRIKFFGAFHEQTLVAGVVIFICNPRVVLAFYISHDEEHQQYRGVNFLFYEIIKWAIREKYKFLDFGIFTVIEDVNWGLGRFKESFGAQGVFRDSYLKML